MPDDLFRREFLEDTKRRRSLVLKFALPVILILPFALISMPDSVKGSGLPLIALFLGVLGSSVGLAKLREGKMLERLSILPISPRRMVLQYSAANVTMDLLQMLVPAAVMVIAVGASASNMAALAVALVLTVVAANGLGTLVALAAGESGEVHLFSALAVIALAGASGLFMQLPEGMVAITSFSPMAVASRALLPGLEFPGAALVASLATTLLVLALMIALAPRAFRAE